MLGRWVLKSRESFTSKLSLFSSQRAVSPGGIAMKKWLDSCVQRRSSGAFQLGYAIEGSPAWFMAQRPKCLLVGYALACPRRRSAERRAASFARQLGKLNISHQLAKVRIDGKTAGVTGFAPECLRIVPSRIAPAAV